MPIYEYDCPHCGRIEVIQKVEEKPLKDCPYCKEAGRKNKITKMVSPAAFHLKGGGWYKTDYGSSGAAGSAKSSSAKSEASAKSDSGTKKETAPKSCGPGCGCH
ncbi:MAG: zinc ribbon domain-containing protein [Oligoflexia bacterium]|nr:zinc ribbon domain-containing protein [Oligoflexia bacterium]